MYDVLEDAYRPTEQMEIPLSLVDEDDRKILQPGVIFRLVIGRERRPGGQIKNTTLVYIRRTKFKKNNELECAKFEDLIGEWN
jgi:hypothetical protein